MQAMATDECQPVTIILTPALTACVMALTDFSGLDWLSTHTGWMSRVLPPTFTGISPAALASSRAILIPLLNASPVRLAGPVKGPIKPIFNFVAAWAFFGRPAVRTPPATAAIPTVFTKSRRVIPSFLSSSFIIALPFLYWFGCLEKSNRLNL